MFETVAVLIVFFFLIGFGLTFYFMIAKSGAKKEAERAQSLKVIQVIQKIGTLPELDCIRVGVRTENCFDRVKLKALSTLLEDPAKMDEYYDVFGNTEIRVHVLFPQKEEHLLYSNPLDGGFETSIYPIMIFDPIKDAFSFGITEVLFYEREA